MAAFLFCLVSCGTRQEKEVGLQFYSVRTLINSPEKYAANHADVLSRLSDMGYKTLELYGYKDRSFFGRSVAEFKSDLDAAGLKALSTHTTRKLSAEELAAGAPSEETMTWWRNCIEDHKALGCEYIVCPAMSLPETLKDLQTYCNYYNAVGKLCAENCISFGYHNHSHEFKKVEGEVVYDYMLTHTDPRYVFFEMDVYWACMAQAYPVEYFNKYPGRFRLLHIKDHAELGQSGMVGFESIFDAARVSGMEHYFVEIEKSLIGDIMESCRVSADYLLDADYVRSSYVGR